MSNAKRKFEKKCLLLYMFRTLPRCQLYLRKEVDTLAWFPSPSSMDLWIARVNLNKHQADQMDIEHFIPRNIKCLPHKPFFRNTNIQHLWTIAKRMFKRFCSHYASWSLNFIFILYGSIFQHSNAHGSDCLRQKVLKDGFNTVRFYHNYCKALKLFYNENSALWSVTLFSSTTYTSLQFLYIFLIGAYSSIEWKIYATPFSDLPPSPLPPTLVSFSQG